MPDKKTEISENSIPVSIITGFLGSGKTTLINHLVKQEGMEATALIVNEFGDIGLDNLLIESAIENTLLLENGCICCSIRGDLIDTLCDLFAKAQNQQVPWFSRILIETTGLADPGPIVRSIQSDKAVVNRCHVDCVITIVDGVHGSIQLARHEEATIQVVHAGIGLISKSDISSQEEIAGLMVHLRRINPTLNVKKIEHGRVDPELLFQEPARHSEDLIHSHLEHAHDHKQHPQYDGETRHHDVSSWSLIHDAPIDRARLQDWLSMFCSLRPNNLLRVKGIIRLSGSDRPLLIETVGNVVSSPIWLQRWPGEKPETQLVLIFKGLLPDAVMNSFNNHVLGKNHSLK